MASEKVLEITAENFEDVISEGVTLVDFWANWCGPCKMIAPIIDSVAEELDGTAKVGKINIDEQESLAMKFRVMSIPTIMIFKNGQAVEQVAGLRQKPVLIEMVKKHL